VDVQHASIIPEQVTCHFQSHGKGPFPLLGLNPTYKELFLFFKFQEIPTGKDEDYF
jgi:hypothetical protein